MRRVQISCDICSRAFYYMEKSVLLGTKPLVDSIRHFIRDPSGVFSVCHLCECRIVQWRHDSRLLLLLNWFLASHLVSLHIIKRITRSLTREILFLPLERKIHIFSPPCNILYICTLRGIMGKKVNYYLTGGGCEIFDLTNYAIHVCRSCHIPAGLA